MMNLKRPMRPPLAALLLAGMALAALVSPRLNPEAGLHLVPALANAKGGDLGGHGRGRDDRGTDDHGGRGRGRDDRPSGTSGGGAIGGGQAGSRPTEIERSSRGVEVTYADGWREELESGRYELKDAQGRTVVERTATEQDVARLSSFSR